MAFSINMHMKKNLFLFVFVTLVLCGCHDAYWELGDSYIYDSGRICMLMDRGYIMDSGYMKIVVPDQVLNFGFDEHYIIAYQKPDSAYFSEYYIDSYKDCSDSTARSQEAADSLEALLDKMLNIQDCYWIICKKDKRVYGPMTESNFNEQCKKKNITLRWVRDMSQHPPIITN